MTVPALKRAILLPTLILAVSAVQSADPPESPKGPPGVKPMPEVPVSTPVERTVTDYSNYTGRLNARQSVALRARATGYLQETAVKEGEEVEKGKLIFQIDPRPYEIQLTQAKSQVVVAETQVQQSKARYDRAQALYRERATPKSEYDVAVAAHDEAKAKLDVAKAALATSQLNLEFTRVTAPISGRIGRFYYTPGNLVVQDQTLLATLVDDSQVYAYFDMDERTLLKLRERILSGKVKSPVGRAPVFLALEGETGYPHTGMLDFMDNRVNAETGGIALRAIFDNPKSPEGIRLMSPGMFARLRLALGEPYPALLVTDRAIQTEHGVRFIYLIDDNGVVRTRRVVPGPLQDDGLRALEAYRAATATEPESGLRANDLVVVGNFAAIKADMTVRTHKVPMPSLATPAEKK